MEDKHSNYNKRELGSLEEILAAKYLEDCGVTILEKNYRNRQGEIDLIGKDGKYLVFFEVKYRSDDRLGGALAAVDHRKQKQICKVADHYRMMHGIGEDCWIRYDVVAMENGKINWLKNAFEHIYVREKRSW